MKRLMGLDLGTTALKLAVFDTEGATLATATREYDLITPKLNYVEEEPEVYWQAFRDSVQEVRRKGAFQADDEIAFAISAQGETLLFLDREGASLRNAIVWMDNRADKEARLLEERFGNEACYHVTGQVSFEATWPASKILWVRRNEPEVFKKTNWFLLIEDYFLYRMTGKIATEGSLVTSSTYWDIIHKTYWKEMLDFLGIREEQLAPVHESGEMVAEILPAVAEELGLPTRLLVCTGALDQAAGAIGAGNIREGMFSENIGAAMAVCVPVNKPVFDPARRMPLHYFVLPDMYMIHTFTTGGMTLRWYRDQFCQPERIIEELGGSSAYDTIGEEAAKAPAGCEGLVMLPHLTGSLAPDVNMKAKGVFFGFSLQHTKSHFARAIMESVGYILRRNLDALREMGIEVGEVRSIGGGSRSRLWNQIKSDINDVTLITMQGQDVAACLGAAILAGKAVGIFQTIEEAVDRMAKVKEVYQPNPEYAETYQAGYEMYQSLFGNLASCFAKTI